MRKNYSVLLLVLFLVGAFANFGGSGVPEAIAERFPTTPERDLRQAWTEAAAIAQYEYHTVVHQTTHPTMRMENAGRSARTETITVDGQVDRTQELLALRLQEGQSAPVSLKVVAGEAYGRLDDASEWERLDEDPDLFGTDDPLGYLVAAENVRVLDAAENGDALFGSGILPTEYTESLTRYAFDLNGVTYAEFMRAQLEAKLQQDGTLPQGLHLGLAQQYVKMAAAGEIWVDANGLPIRQILHLSFPPERGALDRLEAEIVTDFQSWTSVEAATLSATLSSTLASIVDHPQGPLFGASAWFASTAQKFAPMLGGFILLILLVALMGLVIVYRQSLWVYRVTALVMITSMVVMPLFQTQQVHAFSRYQQTQQDEYEAVQAQRQAAAELTTTEQFDPHAAPLSDRTEMNEPVRVAYAGSRPLESAAAVAPQSRSMAPLPNAESSALVAAAAENNCDLLDPTADCDADGLTNGIEVYELGTNPTKIDTDGDNISDGLEVTGFAFGGQQWYLDPLNPDSNGDNQLDGHECPELMDVHLVTGEQVADFSPGICYNSDSDSTPDVFDFDNDGDNVPDRVDGDPFNASGLYDGVNSLLEYTVNLTGQNKPVFVDIEIQPTDLKHLHYTRNVLDWPTNDTEGQIRRKKNTTFADTTGYKNIVDGANGDMILTPLMEFIFTYDGTNPSAGLPIVAGKTVNDIGGFDDISWLDTDTLSSVGITARKGENSNELLLWAPLHIVRDDVSDTPVAWSTRMFYQPANSVSSVGAAQSARLVWMVEALIDTCDADCNDEANWSTRSSVIQTYYDEFTLTALSVREDHGAELIIAAQPANVGGSNYENQLWHLANTLQSALMRAEKKGDSSRFGAADISSSLAAWGIDGLDLTAQSLGSQLDLLAVATDDDTTSFTTGPEVLKSVYSGAAVDDVENLLFIGEETARTIALGQAYPRTQPASGRLTLDLTQSSLDTVATLRVAPYRHLGANLWESEPLSDYSTALRSGLSAAFTSAELTKIATNADNTIDTIGNEADARAGAVTLAESFYLTLFNGLAKTVLSDGVVQGTENLGSYALGGDETATTIAKTLVDAMQAYYADLSVVEALVAAENSNPVASSLSATFAGSLAAALEAIGAVASGDDTSALAHSLQALDSYYRTVDVDSADFTTAVGLSAVIHASAFSQRTGWQRGVYKTYTLASGAYTIKWGWQTYRTFKAATALANGAKNFAVSLDYAGIAKKISNVSKTWAVATYVFALGVIWGSYLLGNYENQLQQAAALADAIGQTIVATILFVLALIPGVGWIIIGVIALINVLMMLICEIGRAIDDDAFEEGSYEDQFVCDGISGAVAKALVYLIFEAYIPYDAENDDRLEISLETPQIDQLTVNDGFVVGNSVSVAARITNTFKLDDPEMALIKTTYLKNGKLDRDTLRDIGKKSTFDYSLTSIKTDLHDSLGYDTHTWDGDQLVFVTPPFSAPLDTAGINQPLHVYLNEGMNLNTIECWGFIGANEDWSCYTGDNDSKYTIQTSLSTYMGDDLKFDVLPTDLDGFITLMGNGRGYRLGWDETFPILRDADGDGLIAQAKGGDDPDDGQWDADGDGLTDGWEEENGFDPLNFDADDDGLSDYWEAFYGTNSRAPDSDGDGLLDSEERFHTNARHPFADDNTTWSGGWTIVYAEDGSGNNLETLVSANPLDADSDDDTILDKLENTYGYNPNLASVLNILSLDVTVDEDIVGAGDNVNYAATISNELNNRYANGLLQAELPIDQVQSTVVVGALAPGSATTLNGSVTAPNLTATDVTSLTVRAGAVIEEPGPERVLWLEMNEAAGATTFADTSLAPDGPHNGTCSGGTCPVANDAYLDFDSGDQIVVPDGNSPDFDFNSFSVNAAVSFDTHGNGMNVIAKGNTFQIKVATLQVVGDRLLGRLHHRGQSGDGPVPLPKHVDECDPDPRRHHSQDVHQRHRKGQRARSLYLSEQQRHSGRQRQLRWPVRRSGRLQRSTNSKLRGEPGSAARLLSGRYARYKCLAHCLQRRSARICSPPGL